MDQQQVDSLFALLDERVMVKLDLGEFNERLAGRIADVWVNPTRRVVLQMQAWAKEHDDTETPVFAGVMLGFNAEETKTLFDKDLAFCNWLVTRCLELYTDYAEKKQKNLQTA